MCCNWVGLVGFGRKNSVTFVAGGGKYSVPDSSSLLAAFATPRARLREIAILRRSLNGLIP
jgi:hypothetical protein